MKYLFVLSPERSGSTLLSMMLGGHSKIISPPELHLMAYPDFESWRTGYPQAFDSLSFLLKSLGIPNEKKIIEKQFAGWKTEKIYDWLLTNANRSPSIIVDKTPRYCRNLIDLERTETFAPFYIWLIRHPLGVAASQISLLREGRRGFNSQNLMAKIKYPGYLLKALFSEKREVIRQIEYWCEVNERIDLFFKKVPANRQHIIYFENMVREPKDVMSSACEFLDLNFEKPMATPHKNIPSSLIWGLGDKKIRAHKTIDASVANNWKGHYREDIFTARMRSTIEKLGVVS